MTRREGPDAYARRRHEQRQRRAARDRRESGAPTGDDWTAPSPDHDDAVQRVHAPVELGELLHQAVRRRAWQDRLRGAAALGRWSDIVGPELAGRCEPVRVAGGTLVLRTGDPAWATQLTYLQRHLLDRVNGVLGPATVVRVQVIVGPPDDGGAPR